MFIAEISKIERPGGMSGGPLLNVNGEVVGVNTLNRMDLRGLGNLFIESNALREAITAVLDNAQRASEAKALRVVLYNDPFNKRARVAKVLTSVAGLTKKEADSSMMAAHTTGRGLVKAERNLLISSSKSARFNLLFAPTARSR